MALFHDVTADYVERSQNAKDTASPLRMSRKELKRLYESGLAIADTETTGLKSGESGLTELAVIRAMTIGEIKAYNREAQKRGMAKDQFIPVPRGSNSDIALIALQQFVLPNRPMIHDRENGFAMPRGSYTSDLQKAYEYDISAYALGVTDTEVIRDKGYGPLIDLKIHGKPANALPSFMNIMQSFLLFTGTSKVGPKQGVAYFNAPFDIPFLRELFVDAMAYEAAKNNEHRDLERAVHRGLPAALDKNYNAPDTTPRQRAEIISHIKKRLIKSGIAQQGLEEYFAPARWKCVLQAYRSGYPELAGHTLDGFMHTMGLSTGDRGAHSAIEDVVLTARGMLRLLANGKLMQDVLPNMAELSGIILRRSHGDNAVSRAAENGRDVEVKLPHGDAPHAKAITNWARSFNRANPADARDPALNQNTKQWFIAFSADKTGVNITASGAEKRPIFLSFAKHLGVSSHLLDGRYPWLSALEANDRPGTFVDVVVDGQPIQDIPWNILRRNVEYIALQPASERHALLTFLRDIERNSDALGGVLLREEKGVRYLRLYGHVSQHGTVDIPWPIEVSIHDARKKLLDNLEMATRLGLVPHAARATLNNTSQQEVDEDEGEIDEKHEVKEQTFSSTTLDIIAPQKEPHIHRVITPTLFQLFKAGLPPDERKKKSLNHAIDTAKFGKHYKITIKKVTQGEHVFYTLDGSLEAFDAFIARKKSDGTFEPIAEKPTNILTDAAWLLDRLQKIPGVPKDGVEVTEKNRIKVHQPLGISTDALALMHVVGLPYRASEKELRFSSGALMQDAFTWSLGISRALNNKKYQKEMDANSIVPSLAKGLKDTSDKGESHKRLDHVKYDPMLGLQLHYKPRSGEQVEIIRIPKDKMVARTMPIGRRRVQRVFARLTHLPEQIETIDKEVQWKVTLTTLEHTLLTHALSQVAADVQWRKNEKGEIYFVISEKDLSQRGNPVYLAMQTTSDLLAKITESTDVPEWYFGAHPEQQGEYVQLELPKRKELFSSSAAPVYQSIKMFLQSMEKDTHEGSSLNKKLKRLMGDKNVGSGSALKSLDFQLRRDPNAQLSNLLNLIERETPDLHLLKTHARDLARCITPSDEKDRKNTLALAQMLENDRTTTAHLIASSDAMAQSDLQQAEKWMELRHKSTSVADKMSIAINGADRLREALNTGASKIASDGSHWKSSLMGACIHARLDMLDKVYLEAVNTRSSDLVDTYAQKHCTSLEAFDMQKSEDIPNLLSRYVEIAALRLAVLYTTKLDPQEKQRIAKAATAALMDAYQLNMDAAQQMLVMFEIIANPQIDVARCRLAGESFLQTFQQQNSNMNSEVYWLPMQLFGKAKEVDITQFQRKEIASLIEKKIKKAYHGAGLVHLYLAAEIGSKLKALEIEKTHLSQIKKKKILAQENTLKAELNQHATQMTICYEKAGYSAENAHNNLRKLTLEALVGDEKFLEQLQKHKDTFSLRDKRSSLIEYTSHHQEVILRAAVNLPHGQEQLETFLQKEMIKVTSLAKKVRAIATNHDDFEACRVQEHKKAILTAKNKMLAELDDLGKIEYHTRRDLEALAHLLHDKAVTLEPHLEATPVKPQRMDLPEYQGLTRNPIPELCEGAKQLDRLALERAKAKIQPTKPVTKSEYEQGKLKCSLSDLLQIPAEQLPIIPTVLQHPPHAPDKSKLNYFILDTSAMIGYFETLRHDTARPSDTATKKPDFANYHANILRRFNALTTPEAHGHMPVRIPDYVFYELSGLMPPMLATFKNRLASIDRDYEEPLLKSQGKRHENLVLEKARMYQTQIDDMVDWSIRLDRRRTLDNKSAIGDRVEELTQLFTLFSYHPEVLLPTRVGNEFFHSARAESSVVAGVGKINHPQTPQYYRAEIDTIVQSISTEMNASEVKPSIANYTLSFNDVKQTPELNFDMASLRIHWGQMYFIGLIDDHQYSTLMRNMSGAEAANEQGYDSNKRFVTYGSLVNRSKETGLTGSGLIEQVKNARSAMIKAGAKEEAVNRYNLSFKELEQFLNYSQMDLNHAIGPAKLTMDQCIFGGLFPGAAIKRLRETDAQNVAANDSEVESLRMIARVLGYKPPEIKSDQKDRYEGLRNALKHQGFFERHVTIEDCLRIQHSFKKEHMPSPKLDSLVEHLPTLLYEAPKQLVKQTTIDGNVELSAPLERIFTQALVQGVLSPAQFIALLVKLDPTSLLVNRAPSFSLKSSGLEIQFKLKDLKSDIYTMSADMLAKTIVPSSLWLAIKDGSAPHFDRRQDFNDLVAVGRRARRSGMNFTEGQSLLDRLLAQCFRTSAEAPQHSMVKAHAVFTELFGKQEGDTIFFQQVKDFESRQERHFQSGDKIISIRKPAECAIAANHRNRLIARRNMGEVSVVKAAHQLSNTDKSSNLWVIGNDRDIVSHEQFLLLNPEKKAPKKGLGKAQDPLMLGKRSETPGVRLRPPIAQQHSRLVGEQSDMLEGDARTHNVPTQDWLEYMGRINGASPQITGEEFTHKYAKSSAPFLSKFLEK